MKILCTSDIHGNLTIYKKIKEICNNENIDLLLLGGDLLPKSNLFSYEDLKSLQENYIENIDDILKDINSDIMYIYGNDDLTDKDLKYGQKISNKIVTYKGIDFMGFDWVNKTPFNSNREKSEEELYSLFNKLYKNYNKENPLIILAHCALKDILDLVSRQENVGSYTLRNMIEYCNPLGYIHGHIHEDYGLDKLNNTYIFNSSCEHTIDMFRGFVFNTQNNEILDIKKR